MKKNERNKTIFVVIVIIAVIYLVGQGEEGKKEGMADDTTLDLCNEDRANQLSQDYPCVAKCFEMTSTITSCLTSEGYTNYNDDMGKWFHLYNTLEDCETYLENQKNSGSSSVSTKYRALDTCISGLTDDIDELTCIDYDYGLHKTTASYVATCWGTDCYEDWDYCLGDNVVEYYCELDNNVGSQQMSCNYGCSGGACTGVTIACAELSPCGTDGLIGTPNCQNGDVYQDYITYTCHYPGTINSYCSSPTTNQLQEICPDGCSNGVCLGGEVSLDTNNNGVVNCDDYFLILNCMDQPISGSCSRCDLNSDGMIQVFDLSFFNSNKPDNILLNGADANYCEDVQQDCNDLKITAFNKIVSWQGSPTSTNKNNALNAILAWVLC